MTMKSTSLLAAAALAFGLLGAAAIAQPAQPAQPDVKHIGDFVVRCFPVKSVAPCDMYEDRANRETGQRVLTFSLAYMPSSNRYILQVSVPLGVSIEKGVVITGSSYTSPALAFRRCDQAGCYVEAEVNKDLLDNFAKLGKDAKIRVVPDGGGKAFDFPFSFDGFSAAHDDMVASNKAKAATAEELQAAQAAAQAQQGAAPSK
jgi:invasion protein IalB